MDSIGGIDTGSWEMSATHGEHRRDIDLNLPELLRYEKEPALKEIREKLFSHNLFLKEGAILRFVTLDPKDFVTNTCEFLKERSLAQFGKKNMTKRTAIEAAPSEDGKGETPTIDAR